MLPLPRGAVWLLLFLFCAALYINGVQADGRVVCYYTNWSVYRPGTAKFNPQNINPYLCTHLIYAFGGFTKDNQMKPFDKYQDIEQGGYAKFTGLKTYNKQLKTMIAIGGWNEASSRFSPLVANPERRQKFIKNILKFLRQNHFDGIDLDWEYPAHREGGKPRDRDNYAQFVQELRAEFERESEKTGRPRLLLTMAVPAGIEYIEKGYDIPKLNKYLDWFNVLTYDFHSSHEPSVNHHAPLYSLEEESEYNYDAELNIDYSIKFYLNAGADRDKLVLGIPTYGRSYTLINEESTEIGAPAEAPGEQGDATREKGYLAYYEICQNIKEDPEWTVVQPNPNAMGPYAYRRNQWVGYDDEAIVRKKAQYVVENGLGGIMFWAIDNDDFRGTCTGKPYPLIEAAKEAMLDSLGLGINEVSKPSAPQKPSRSRSRENSSSTRNRITTTEHKLTYAERKGGAKRTQQTQQTTRKQQSTTTTAPTTFKLTEAEGSSLYIGGRTTTPPPPTTPDPGTDFKCEEEGFFQHPRDCKKYYWCLDSGPSGLGIVAHQFTCPSGLYFNPAADSCDFARNVPCKTKKSTTAAPITSTTTTTARPTSSYNRITAATSRPTTFFRTTPRTTTTTTTLAPEEEEYEDEEDNVPSTFAKNKSHHDKDSEEDPKVIKELIELIRKVGGVEELEKHLLRKDDGTISIKESSSSSSSSQTATTPSSISKSLYEKVLSKPNALNSFRNRFTSTSSFRTTKTQIKTQEHSETDSEESQEGDSKSSGATSGFSKYSSVLRSNSRQGPQSEGIDKLSEFNGFQKEKKQYITINRNRGTKKTDELEEEEVAGKLSSESHVEETEEEVEKSSVKSTRRPLSASTPAYSTIRRTRPSTTTETTQDEEEEQQEEKEVTERKTYSSLNRSRIRGTTTTELPEVTEVTAGSSRYKYLERTRPTRPTTESSNKVSDEDDDDIESDNQENTVHFKAVKNIESTRETQQQQEITKNTQRTYASIGRRTTTSSTTATPETETTSAAKTTTTATPTTSTTETPLTTTTPLTILETTTPESILLTTIIPITTTTNPITTTSSTTTTKTTTTSLTNDEDVLENLATTTSNPNDISSDISETLLISQNINSLLTESSSSIYSTPSPTTESGLDTNDSQLTTTTETTSTSTAINDSDNLTKTEDTEHEEEVNLVSKQTNKTLYSTRTRITTTTTPPTTTTTTNSDIETTNAKKTLGVRRQQILLNRSSQKTVSTSTDTAPTTTATESVNNDFLGTVSSPRPFGFPKRRIRPTSETNTEEVVNSNDETIITRQKTTTTTATTKLSAAANNKFKKYQFQRRTTTTTTTSTTTTTEKPVEEVKEDIDVANAKQGAAKTKIQDGFTTTPSPSTTLLHIFTLSDNEQTTPNPLTFPRVIAERVKPKHKVVEINRIVEVNSKEEKLRRKSKANIIIPVEGSQTFKVESLPHVEPLGEISVVKYVHQVDGSDITIEGRSTVTDYTPTEPTVPWTSEPVRHSLTEGRVEERYGKALVPEVIREAIETSTISLEGLFESARKGKVLNTVDDATFVNTESTTTNEHSELNKAGSAGEGFSILKSIAFDTAKINLEPNSQEIEKVSESNTSSSSTTKTSVSSSSITSDIHEVNAGYSNIPVLTTTPAPEILNVESSTVATEETKATTVAAALFPQYVRPIVPLLRPESNESSPLVISIANLDKVILSKVRKMVDGVEVEVDEQHQDQPQTQIRTQQLENNIVSNSPSVTTETPVTLTTPINLISILSNNNAEQSLKVNNQQESQQLVNNIISNTQTETNEIPKTTLTNPTNTISVLNSRNDDQSSLETQIQQHSTEILDSNGAFSSRLASVIKAPLSNSLSHIEKKVKTVKNTSENSLDNAEQVTQTELYTINEGSVGSTTSSTLGSKISETISYSSETTVVRLKQPRKSKSRKFKNKKNSITTFTTIAPATELFSQ